jgi:hypothetical protein
LQPLRLYIRNLSAVVLVTVGVRANEPNRGPLHHHCQLKGSALSAHGSKHDVKGVVAAAQLAQGIYQALPLQFQEAAHASVERHQRRRRVPVHRLLHFISSTPAAVIPR